MITSSLLRKVRRGFTLIELLLVIGIIAILASIVIVAINPTKQLGDARNAQRRSDVNTVLNAVYQYAIDNNGTLPSGIPTGSTAAKQVCRATISGSACATANGVSLLVLTGSYIVSIPGDPQIASGTGYSNYMIYRDTQGRVTVYSASAEQGASITVTR